MTTKLKVIIGTFVLIAGVSGYFFADTEGTFKGSAGLSLTVAQCDEMQRGCKAGSKSLCEAEKYNSKQCTTLRVQESQRKQTTSNQSQKQKAAESSSTSQQAAGVAGEVDVTPLLTLHMEQTGPFSLGVKFYLEGQPYRVSGNTFRNNRAIILKQGNSLIASNRSGEPQFQIVQGSVLIFDKNNLTPGTTYRAEYVEQNGTVITSAEYTLPSLPVLTVEQTNGSSIQIAVSRNGVRSELSEFEQVRVLNIPRFAAATASRWMSMPNPLSATITYNQATGYYELTGVPGGTLDVILYDFRNTRNGDNPPVQQVAYRVIEDACRNFPGLQSAPPEGYINDIHVSALCIDLSSVIGTNVPGYEQYQP